MPDSAMTPFDSTSTNELLLAVRLHEAEASLAACKLHMHAQAEQLELHRDEAELFNTQLSVLHVSEQQQHHPQCSTAQEKAWLSCRICFSLAVCRCCVPVCRQSECALLAAQRNELVAQYEQLSQQARQAEQQWKERQQSEQELIAQLRQQLLDSEARRTTVSRCDRNAASCAAKRADPLIKRLQVY